MPVVHFITHPEVAIDPAVPVPEWPLAPSGIERARAMLQRPWVQSIGAVFSSAERKAVETANIIADHLGISPVVIASLGENDRSSTGYLPKSEFETLADAFFAQPAASVRGWERAIDAQQRIVAAVDEVLDGTVRHDVAIVSHGAVGTLLLCHLKRVSISRVEDQPGIGGGNLFRFDVSARRLIQGWRPVEAS